jgi:choloylglycine hydrolase
MNTLEVGMRVSKTFIVFCFLISLLIPRTGLTCTSIYIDQVCQRVFGKNYDWHLEQALIIINKRGVSKRALVDEERDPPPYAKWISRYGSLTFNQYGREIPSGGINEAGLVVEQMMLRETRCPGPDSRPAILPVQWIQYQLDNSATVEDVISSSEGLRVLQDGPGIHYLVADRNGGCASFEFLDGKLVCHTREALPVKALTNNTYLDSLNFLKEHKGFGGTLDITKGEHSMTRFVKAADMLKEYGSNAQMSAVDYAFKILSSVKQESHAWATRWSIVYDMWNLKVYFRTFSKQKTRYIDVHLMNFSCSEPVKVLDINAGNSGDVTGKFKNYSQKVNLDLIRHSFRGTSFLMNTPEEDMIKLSKYPESFSCTEKKD